MLMTFFNAAKFFWISTWRSCCYWTDI